MWFICSSKDALNVNPVNTWLLLLELFLLVFFFFFFLNVITFLMWLEYFDGVSQQVNAGVADSKVWIRGRSGSPVLITSPNQDGRPLFMQAKPATSHHPAAWPLMRCRSQTRFELPKRRTGGRKRAYNSMKRYSESGCQIRAELSLSPRALLPLIALYNLWQGDEF